jgi:small-conductance mechanosensitive channel
MHQWVTAIAAIAVGGAAAAGLRLLLRHLAGRAERTRSQADDMLATLLLIVAPAGAVIAGAWVAALALPLSPGWRANVSHVLVAAIVLTVTLGAGRSAAQVVRAGALAHSGIAGSATIFVNITRITVLAIGLLILLATLGISITPLLTALGVGGLAVALALQDTLTNLFAGVHILVSGKVQQGDFIRLESGEEGYVVDTNWRNTTIRQLPNNLVVVPNATLASSTVINYYRPEQEMSVLVQVGVSYDSDLEHVERVTAEVGREVMQSVEGAVPGHEPSIRYHTFGESSIGFSVILRASEPTAQYLIVHEFIKRLHRRYGREGIEIPFPIRTVVHPRQPQVPPAAPSPEAQPQRAL